MLRKFDFLAIVFICTAVESWGSADAALSVTMNFSGQYRCLPLPDACRDSGQSFTVTQSGSNLAVKNDKGIIGAGTVTSEISLSMGPPWNMLGVASSDGHSIQWSNGTEWRKQ